ncbi:MAG: AsmA-like C-terminal region-containing protein [Janthinobacterium lividum]
MNRPGQAPPLVAAPPCPAPPLPPGRWRGAWRGAGGDALRLLRGLALFGLGLLLLLLGAAGGLAWRLSRAPLPLDWLAPRLEAAARARGVPLSLAGLSLGWSGFRDPGAPLRVTLRDVRLGPPDHPAATAARLDASFALLPLASGHAVPGLVSLDDARVALVREADGLHLADGTPLRPPPSPPGAPPPPAVPPWLAALHELHATGTRVTVLDRPLGVTWAAAAPRIALHRDAAGLSGDAEATLSVLPDPAAAPAAGVTLRATLRPAPDGPGWSVASARLDPLDPAALGRALPGLPDHVAAALAAADLPLTLAAEATLDAGLAPRRFSATLDAAPGRVALGGATLGVSALALRAAGTPEQATLTLDRLALAAPAGAQAPPPTFSGAATLTRDAAGVLARASLAVDHAAFAELAGYWPPGVARNARGWITRNITAGTAHDGRFTLTLRAAPDGAGLHVESAGGVLLADDATLHWLRPVPPLEHMDGRMVLESPDALSVATRGGTTGAPRRPAEAGGPVQLGTGLVRITGLSAPDQVATIGADLHASLPALVRLLSHPRLHLLSAHPPGFTAPRGRVEARLDMTLPLEADLDADRIGLHASAHATEVHLGDVAAGQDIDAGTIDLDVTTAGLAAHGTATVAHMPTRLTLDEDFRAGPPAQVVQRATVRADADAARLGAAGLDLAGAVDGPIGLDARYSERRDGRATVAVAADLSAAALDVPLGWTKPAGPPASARAVLLLDHGHLRGVGALRADAPGLLLRGHAEAGTHGTVLHIERALVGRTEASGTVRFPQHPGAPVRAAISGPVLDLSSRIEGSPAPAPAPAPPPPARPPAAPSAPGPAGTPWVLDARFGRVLLGRGRSIAPVSAHAEDDGRRLDAAQLQAGDGDASLLLTVSAQPAPRTAVPGTVRHVELQAADAGALLSSLDLTDQVRGGHLALGGTFAEDSPGHPVDATLRLDGFNLLGAPAAARLLQAATVFGVVDLLHGPGLHVAHMELPFRMAGRVIDLHDARASSASLGATAAGRVDLAARTLDLAGTIVPAYLLNQLPGRLPLVGHLFSPERGGGLFAATYTVRGPLNDPRFGVNPLAMLAPGALRRLLGLP